MFNFHTARPCSHEIKLSIKEANRLKEIAKELGWDEWRVMLNALRLYDAVHSGQAEVVYKDKPYGLPELD